MSIRALFEMTRPVNVFLAAITVILAIIVGKGDIFYLSFTVPAIVSVAFITAAGNIINDYADVEIDRVNKPLRPLPSKRVSKHVAKILALFMFGVGILSSFFLPPLCVVIAITNSIFLVLYALFFKRSGFLGNIIVSYMVASLFVFGAATTGEVIRGILLAIIAFFCSFVREILKDLEDVRGDKIGGAKTLPTQNGRKKTNIIIVSLLLLAVLFSPIPYLTGIFTIYYIFIMLISDIIFIKILINIIRKKKVNVSKNVRMINIALNIALLAFFAGLVPW